MTKFYLGDRVAVYNRNTRIVGVIGKLIESDNDTDSIGVICDHQEEYGGEFLWVHVKQCRKLKQKKKLYVLVPSYGVSCVQAFYDERAAIKQADKDSALRVEVFVKCSFKGK